MTNVIIDKLKNKIKSATIARSNDIKLTIEESNHLILEILDLYKKITELQTEVIDLQKEKQENDIVLVSNTLNG